MGRIKNYLKKVKELFIEVYLIGYSHEGESIVFVIKTQDPDNNVIFSGVVDCYEEENGINKTIEILEKFKIKELDFLCWTHPDEDHSLGIDKIFEQYISKNTRIVIPQSLLDLSDKLNDYTQRICNNISNKILKLRDTQMYDVVSAQAGLPLVTLSIGSYSRLEPYKFNITSISPFYDLVLSQYKNNKLKNNHFCIALLLEFEGINLLFTSDIEKRTINRFYDNIILPNNIHYIKIPHHGSSKSKMFLNFLGKSEVENKSVACSTVYTNSKIPDLQLLNQYKGICNRVFCTDPKVKTHVNGKKGYGIFGVKIDVINKKIAYKCSDDTIEL